MSAYCEIGVNCELDPDWSGWLEGLTINFNDRGESIILGQLRDQAAFYGLLAKVRDMGLCMIWVKYEIDSGEESKHAG